MRVRVVIPTTDGPATVLRLASLSGAAVSVMRIQEDYRPLALSERYNAFLGEGGPVSQFLDIRGARFELRLSRSIESGRSWELPVALAHWLQAQGHRLGTEKPDLTVWATGALDNDLRIIEQDYHIAQKLERSAAVLDSGPHSRPVIFIIPNSGPKIHEHVDGSDAEARFVADLVQAISELKRAISPADEVLHEDATPPKATGKRVRFVPALAIGCVLAGGALIFSQSSSLTTVSPEPGLQDVVETGEQSPIVTVSRSAVAASLDESNGANASSNGAGYVGEVQTALMFPELVLDYAPADDDCLAVTFGATPPHRETMTAEPDGYGDMSLGNLCAIGVALPSNFEGAIQVEPPRSLQPHVFSSDWRDSFRLEPGDLQILQLKERLPPAIVGDFVFRFPDGSIVRMSAAWSALR